MTASNVTANNKQTHIGRISSVYITSQWTIQFSTETF